MFLSCQGGSDLLQYFVKMMATEEKLTVTEDVSKMEELAVKEKPKPEIETKGKMLDETSKEELEVEMETEETQIEDLSKVTAGVAMETELTPPPTKEETPKAEETPKKEETPKAKETPKSEETPKAEETSQKDGSEEQKSVELREDKVQEETVEDKVKDDQERKTVDEDKVSNLKTSSQDSLDIEPVKATEELIDDFNVLGTDDENDEAKDKTRSSVWMPKVSVIIDLYQKLDKEGVLELQWKCPGRRLPPEEVDEKKEDAQKLEKETEKLEVEKEKQEEPTEFDFDVDVPSVTNMTPRRTPGSGQAFGSSKKRVARMDKIFNDMLRHKRIDEERERFGDESDDAANRSDTTPQRPVAKFRIRKDF